MIVPVYNTERWLNSCIDSLLCQSCGDFSLLLIDDGSTDRSGAICDSYAARDSRVRVLHQPNRGQAMARNAGLDAAASDGGEWIAFVDSDDTVHPAYLQTLLGAAEQSGVLCSACVYRENGSGIVAEIPQPCVLSSDAYYGRHIGVSPPAKLFHRSLFRDLRFPDRRRYEDEFTVYKAVFASRQVAFVDAPLYDYRLTENSVMRKSAAKPDFSFFDGYEEQLAFLAQNGHDISFKAISRNYLNRMKAVYFDTTLDGQERKALQRRLQGFLRRFGREAGCSLFRTPVYYDFAYPAVKPVTALGRRLLSGRRYKNLS